MRRLSFVFFVVITLLIAPVVPFFGYHPIFAQGKPQGTTQGTGQGTSKTTDYVDRDFPDAMDAAKEESKRDMNAVGHVASVNTTMYSDLIRRIAGPIKGVTTNSTDQAYLEQMYKESFAYGADSALAYLYAHPPASTYAFVKDMGQSLGFIPKSAYAQGVGFSGLTQLLPMWKAFRNIAYLLLAIFMIVIGFLVMFRKKIDPKTVVTVQNALPNIVVTLLLITFSYAIVGVLIDFMYLFIMIAVSILQPISNGAIDQNTANTFVSSNFWLVFRKMLGGGLSSIDDIAAMFGDYIPIVSMAVPGTIGLIATLFTGNVGATVLGAVAVPVLLLVIIFFAFLIAIVRLFFLLVSAYIQIILALLISPFQLLLSAFPGSHAFENWIKNLIANIAVFPITAIMLLVGTILVKADYGGARLWGPPFLIPAGTGSAAGGGMGGVIGLGILFAIPSVAGSIKEALKAKPMVQAGPSAILGPIGTGAGQLMNYGYQLSMITHYLPQKKPSAGGKAE